MPLPGMRDLPSFAFAGSPAETPRGPVYEFVLHHVVELDDPCDLSRMEISSTMTAATDRRTVGDVAELVRSKNAGPFWQTLDIFCDTDEDYRVLAAESVLTPARIADLYRVDARSVKVFRLPNLRVIKISFPRPVQLRIGRRPRHSRRAAARAPRHAATRAVTAQSVHQSALAELADVRHPDAGQRPRHAGLPTGEHRLHPPAGAVHPAGAPADGRVRGHAGHVLGAAVRERRRSP